MAARGSKSSGWFGAHLQEEKDSLSEIAIATKATDMTDCVKRIIRQIRGEMKRQGITEFSESDIVLKKR